MVTHVKIIHDRFEYESREPYEDDSWDRGDTAADIFIKGIKVVPVSCYRDLTVNFDIDVNKAYFLLWADYDTGDSFGRDCNQVEFVDLFETEEAAVQAQKELLGQPGFTRKYAREDGTVIQYHCPWNGYFEHLNALEIEVVRVTKI